MNIPSKNNNQFQIDYDFPGLCAYCHTEIAEFRGSHEVMPGVFRPVITRLKGNVRQTLFTLDNGEKMHVILCDQCASYITPDKMGELMESIINGFHVEVSELCRDWKESKKSEYLKDRESRSIKNRFDKSWTREELISLTTPRKDRLKVKSEGVGKHGARN